MGQRQYRKSCHGITAEMTRGLLLHQANLKRSLSVSNPRDLSPDKAETFSSPLSLCQGSCSPCHHQSHPQCSWTPERGFLLLPTVQVFSWTALVFTALSLESDVRTLAAGGDALCFADHHSPFLKGG